MIKIIGLLLFVFTIGWLIWAFFSGGGFDGNW